VLAGAYGTGNGGDEAVLAGALAALATRLPRARITVLSLSEARSRRLHPGAAVVHSGVVRGQWGTWKAIRGADLLILGGGGILQDRTSLGNLLYHLGRLGMAWLGQTPFALCGVGIGPIRHPLGAWLTGRLLRRAALVQVRDQPSAAQAVALGLPGDSVQVTADLAFLLPRPAAPPRVQSLLWLQEIKASGRPLIGISLRPEVGSRRQRTFRSPRYRTFLGQVARQADLAVRRLGARLVFVSLHAGQDDPIAAEFRALLSEPEALHLLPGALRPEELAAGIGLLDALWGMRLHSLIFAARAAVPFLGLSYDPKVAGLCQRLGLSDFAIGAPQLDPDQLAGKVEALWVGRAGIREKLLSRVGQLCALAEDGMDAVARLVSEERHGR
jgi:polysaccharide pyruvyl transferase CsaB